MMRKVVGFMCKIDHDWHMGNDPDGTKIYPSLEALQKAHPMWEQCGVVSVVVEGHQVLCEGEC